MSDTRNLDGQVALVTGSAVRLGAAIVRELHANGASVAIHYRSSGGPADELATELNAMRDGSAKTFKADLLDTPKIPGLVDSVAGWKGRLDVVVNNASSFYPTPLAEVTEESWEDLVGSNLKAPLFIAKAAEPHLRAAQGSLINIVDIHAQRPLKDHLIYGPAKAGLAMLTRSLAKDLGPDIRVNGVSPGAILWPEGGMTETAKTSILEQIPLKRTGSPDDIARCVLFLVRDAGYITGQIIAVDGGRSVGW